MGGSKRCRQVSLTLSSRKKTWRLTNIIVLLTLKSTKWRIGILMILMVLTTYIVSDGISNRAALAQLEFLNSNRCKNGGLAVFNKTTDSFGCNCPNEYNGELCEKVKPVSFISWLMGFVTIDVSKGGPSMWWRRWSALPVTSELQLKTVYAYRATLAHLEFPYCHHFDVSHCKNGGLVVFNRTEDSFGCKCPKEYDGELCERVKPISFISWLMGLLTTDVSKGGPSMWWSVLPFTSKLQLKTVYAFHQNLLEYSFPGSGNEKLLNDKRRILPPARPLILCPSHKNLPPLTKLYAEFFERKLDQFKPDPYNRNLLFHAYYQYFILQFFDSNSNLKVTASQLYGSDTVTERSLRSFSGGKLLTHQVLNDEHYPPMQGSKSYFQSFFNSAPDSMDPVLSWFDTMTSGLNTYQSQWAVGHPWSTMNPMLFVISTLWVREHNRVCDVLSLTWPDWEDEQMYTTARRIVTGQMMNIMMNEIINVQTGHAFPLKLQPEVFHRRHLNISGSATPIELLLTMTMSSLPERFKISSMASTMFGDQRRVLEDGLKDTLKYMVGEKVGMVGSHNDGVATKPLTKFMMSLSRENAIQSFNNYRRQFGLPAYDSFNSLTGYSETASELANLYETIEDVELLTGVLAERTKSGTVPTVTVMTDSFIVNAILTNDLTSELSWKPKTFGGDIGFHMIKDSNLKSFVCGNLKDTCDGLEIQLYVK